MNVWVDIDNAPHVLVLDPILRELEARGCRYSITARDYGQTLPLLDLYNRQYSKFGHHAGSNKGKKLIELATRSISLCRFARDQSFDVGVCHGSRGIIFPSVLLRMPLVVLMDYEYAFSWLFRRGAAKILMPEVIPDGRLRELGFDLSKIVKYPGLKEELYVYEFEPDASVLDDLQVERDKVVVVIRPPATMAHYHRPESEDLFWAALTSLARRKDTCVILLPRTAAQAEEIKDRLRDLAGVIVPKRAVHGPNLLWHADLVLGGGGTINREAACLGVPVYSFYRGPLGAVDRYLADTDRLRLLSSENDVSRIRVEKRSRNRLPKLRERSSTLRRFIADAILETARGNGKG